MSRAHGSLKCSRPRGLLPGKRRRGIHSEVLRSFSYAVALSLLGACGGSASSHGHDAPEGGSGATEDSGRGDSGASASAGAEKGGNGGSSGMVASGGQSAAGGATSAGTGGTAGSTTGGAANIAGNPAGGAAGAAPLTLPEGCEARARTESATSCTLYAYCPVQSQVTGCEQLPSGDWQCHCDYAPGRVFQIEGASGLQACAVAAGACGVKETELGKEECSTRVDESTADECLFGRTCRREVPLAFAPKARAWLVREGSASCDRADGVDTFGCTCTYASQTREYDLFAKSGPGACAPLAEFCMTGVEPEYGAEERCTTVSATTAAEGCERQDKCAPVMALGGDVFLAELSSVYSTCVAHDGGGADCYCSTEAYASMNLQFDAAPSDALCASTISVCKKGGQLTPKGNASCESTSLNVYNRTACEEDLSCHQSATLADQSLVAEGRLLVRCERNEATDPWDCSCASDQQTAKFRLGAAEATGAEACDQAPAACLKHIDVHLGLYGELVTPPDPLAP